MSGIESDTRAAECSRDEDFKVVCEMTSLLIGAILRSCLTTFTHTHTHAHTLSLSLTHTNTHTDTYRIIAFNFNFHFNLKVFIKEQPQQEE
jgi:hypothetical protein